MDPQSPPKRMTRARAAKTTTSTEPTIKTTRIVTAATKAKATRSTATAPTSSSTNKRKVRPDDTEDEDPLDREPAKPAHTSMMKATRATRGRPKKAVDEPAPEQVVTTTETTRAARGRPKKTAEPAPTEPSKPARTTRTRKTKEEDADADAAAAAKVEPPKKTTRGRPPASTIASRQAATKPTIKKSVKFEEPEKENMIPPTTAAGRGSTKPSESASGLRARPMRRPGIAGRTVRGTKASASASDKGEKPLPLSPKKVNQLTLSKTDSDDELAMNDKPPVRSLMRNPIKPPMGSKKAQTHAPVAETEDGDASDAEMQESTQALMLGTPAKRLPASPWKNSIKSPAKRVEGVLAPPTQTQASGETSKSPSKLSLLQSPAKRAPVMKSVDLNGGGYDISPMKMSLLSSPAKRIFSPMKAFAPAGRDDAQLGRSPAPKATVLATPLPAEANLLLGEADEQDEQETSEQHSDDAILDSPTRLRFPGRLSAVLPRHADPVLKDMVRDPTEEVDETHDAELDQYDIGSGEPMVLDDAPEVEEQEQLGDSNLVVASASTTNPTRSFGLRDKDLDAYNQETDSEDESSPQQEIFSKSLGSGPSTPCPRPSATPKSRLVSEEMRSSRSGTAKRVRMEGKFGFTPLADQLNGWTAGPSPLKTGIHCASPVQAVSAPTTVHAPSPATNRSSPVSGQSPVENQFFEDEMMIRPDTTEEAESVMAEESVSPVLEDIPFTEEDVALAAEANEMSLMEPERVEELIHNQSLDDSLSEASQEYGDENAIPIDPTLVPSGDAVGEQEPVIPLVTPQRVIRREFHTVSKVPLKPASEETPRRMMKTRSHTISRLPVQRPTQGMNRNATVISYSPTKNTESNTFEDDSADQEDEDGAELAPGPVTPQKSEVSWSTMGTPARTPRPDIDPAMLRGAVVFVDVHTSEGADASGIFVELLGQMGARCVKSWSWNPSSPPGEDGHSSKVGITHVVYKDGGKRTLEKVRESGGVVQCVGVSWVLDCERENQWLDEAPYYIDTSLVPRGGARRRKSMEPRALANLNGMLVPTPVRNNSATASSNNTPTRAAPSTPAGNKSGSRRRESGLWMRTPEDNSQNSDENSFMREDDDDDMDWNACILTPVPKTPAPETIARYAANINPDTPTTTSSLESDDPLSALSPADIMTRTCPPKATSSMFRDMGAGILKRDKDEGVLMRLMAARRKSLQFAPKVASPLSKSWYH